MKVDTEELKEMLMNMVNAETEEDKEKYKDIYYKKLKTITIGNPSET